MKLIDFSEVIDFLEGPGVRKWQFRTKGVKLVNIRNLVNDKLKLSNTENFLDEKEVSEKYKHFLLQEGDYVMASSGVTWGKIAEVEKKHLPLCLNTSIIKLKPKDERVEKRFLWYFIKSTTFTTQIDRIITGSAQPNFGPSHLKNIQIPLPPLDAQKRIATLLDTADSLRQKDKALLQKYDALAQSLFLELFGDPVRNEKGWEKKSLKNVTSKIGSGSTPSGGKESYFTSGTSLIRSLNVHDRKFKMKDLAFIDDSQASKLKNVIVESNDILFNITGASVCRCTIVPDEILPARVNQHVSILRAKTEILNPEFLCFQIISDNVKRNLYSIATQGGATREAITKDQLEMYEVICPPIKLQNQFAEQIKLIEAQKALVQENLAKSEALFMGLLAESFG